jgi:AraC-like DNA-binding protein
MAFSETDIGQHLRVRTHWARRHKWLRGATWDEPPIPAYVFWLVQRGVLDVTLDGESFRIKAGEVWLHAYTKDRFIAVREDAQWFSLGLDADFYGNVDVLAPLAPAHWRPVDYQPLERWLLQLVETENSNTWEGGLIYNSLTRAVLAWCWQERGGGLEQLVQENLSPWLHRVLEKMRQDPATSVHDHVAGSGYSPAQFRRHFQRVLGCSPREYLMQLRLEHARDLLESTMLPMSHVAEQAGFASPEHFSRQFMQRFGASPSRYRQLSRHARI